MKAGSLGGYPVVGIKANVYDGSYHEVDSSEMAFHIAGSMCFKEAMKKAEPVLLEPIMKVEVTMPEEYMGDVIGDINSRRGRIESMEDVGMFRFPLCSAMRPIFVPERRDVETTQCSSSAMSRFRRMLLPRSLTSRNDVK